MQDILLGNDPGKHWQRMGKVRQVGEVRQTGEVRQARAALCDCLPEGGGAGGCALRDLPGPLEGGVAHLWPSGLPHVQAEREIVMTKLSHDFIHDKHLPSDQVTREPLSSRTGPG